MLVSLSFVIIVVTMSDTNRKVKPERTHPCLTALFSLNYSGSSSSIYNCTFRVFFINYTIRMSFVCQSFSWYSISFLCEPSKAPSRNKQNLRIDLLAIQPIAQRCSTRWRVVIQCSFSKASLLFPYFCACSISSSVRLWAPFHKSSEAQIVGLPYTVYWYITNWQIKRTTYTSSVVTNCQVTFLWYLYSYPFRPTTPSFFCHPYYFEKFFQYRFSCYIKILSAFSSSTINPSRLGAFPLLISAIAARISPMMM